MAQHAVRSPVFGEFHDTTGQVSGILFQLGLKPGKERKSVSGGTGKPGNDLAVEERAKLFGATLQHLAAHCDLAIAGQNNFPVAPYAENRRRTDSFTHWITCFISTQTVELGSKLTAVRALAETSADANAARPEGPARTNAAARAAARCRSVLAPQAGDATGPAFERRPRRYT